MRRVSDAADATGTVAKLFRRPVLCGARGGGWKIDEAAEPRRQEGELRVGQEGRSC